MITFNEFCARYNVTLEERREVAWFLAQWRARKTLEACLGALPVSPEAKP